MKIALDYDETFTADPELWKPFVAHCKARLHEVAFVTARGDGLGWMNEDIKLDAESLKIDIVFCTGKQKAHCWDADIWIDDAPAMIPTYSQLVNCAIGCEHLGDLE